MGDIQSLRDLRVYRNAFNAAMKIFELTKSFPPEEKYSLTDQVRRSSRSVCANIGEAWRKRRYRAAFISKLSDSESEAEETRVWLEFALGCKYMKESMYKDLEEAYDEIHSQLSNMIQNVDKWTL